MGRLGSSLRRVRIPHPQLMVFCVNEPKGNCVSTRARFGILNSNGTITSVYHHWDGYPDWLGKRLVENYSDENKLREVMNGGDMSSIESDRTWNSTTREPQPLYYKERGENCPAKMSLNLSVYHEHAKDCGAEFWYLFHDGKWTCYQEKRESSYKEVAIP